MKLVLSIILISIFFILALIHFNWVFGGLWGFSKSLPTSEQGKRIFNPRKVDCAIVGFGLLAFGIFYFINLNFFQINLPAWVLKIGSWAIPIIFLLRSIGDFKYVGFFKKIKQTEFAKVDTKFFTPLCLSIGIIGFVLLNLN